MLTAQEAGQIALKARMSFEAHIAAVAGHYIQSAAERGEQSCSFPIKNIPHAEFHAKRVEAILTKAGYKASHTVGRDGSITVAVCWLKSIEDFPLLAALPKGK